MSTSAQHPGDLLLYEGIATPTSACCLKNSPFQPFFGMCLSIFFAVSCFTHQQPKIHDETQSCRGCQQIFKKWKNQREQTTRNNADKNQSAVSCCGSTFWASSFVQLKMDERTPSFFLTLRCRTNTKRIAPSNLVQFSFSTLHHQNNCHQNYFHEYSFFQERVLNRHRPRKKK